MSEAKPRTPIKKVSKKAPAKKTAAAKPRAKKKTAAATAKTKVVKKAVNTTAAKTVRKPRPKVVKKPAKSAARKQTSTRPVKPKASTPKKPVTPETNEVVLPNRMSIRAREKALVYAEQLGVTLDRLAYPAVMALGLCFVAFGAYFSAENTVLDDFCSESDCAAQLLGAEPISLLNDPVTVGGEIDVVPMKQIPSELSIKHNVVLDTENVNELRAYLVPSSDSRTSARINLEAERILNQKYRVVISPEDLNTDDEYTLKVEAFGEAVGDSRVFTVPNTFAIASSLTDTLDEGIQIETTTLSSSDLDLSNSNESLLDTPELELPILQSDLLEEEKVETPSDTQPATTDEPLITGSLDTTQNLITNEPELTVPGVDVAAGEEYVRLSVSTSLTGYATINIDTNVAYRSIEFALGRAQETGRQTIGTTFSRTRFTFNTRSFPDGDYVLHARINPADESVQVPAYAFTIKNEIEPILGVTPITTSPLETDRPLFDIDSELERSAVDDDPKIIEKDVTDSVVVEEDKDSTGLPEKLSVEQQIVREIETLDRPVLSLRESIRERAAEKLRTDSDALNEVFRNYAISIQSGDSDMIRESQARIDSLREDLVQDALTDDRDRLIASDLSVDLQEKLEEIKVKVETFETIRREKQDNAISTDTDGDGITDVDEKLLFGTDPLKADTDADGFTDGAEIIKGFNPLDSASEATIVYESPKETVGIAPNENLVIRDVVPDIERAASSTIRTVVRGIALPNSFVTLYVFSSPTIVTVRTEADGSFEYTFAKELEDGEHQVFVALTDNAGEIVAQSAPFRFVKEAEAFTPVQGEETVGLIQPDDATSGASAYRTVLAMSVVALGIMLILLGVGLRTNRPETQSLVETTA